MKKKKSEKIRFDPLFYYANEIKDLFNITNMTLFRWLKSGLMPKPIKIGIRRAWERAVIDRLVDEWRKGGAEKKVNRDTSWILKKPKL